jgi:CheY-like chemotaxis protein
MAASLSQLRVLVVDDDPSIRTGIAATLEAEGAEVKAVASGSGAVGACRRNAFDVVILDQCAIAARGQNCLQRAPLRRKTL